MWVLGKGRSRYLDFINNLPAQFVLAGLCALAVVKATLAFENDRVSDGAALVFITLVLGFMLLFAAVANFKNFFKAFSRDSTVGFMAYKRSLSGMTTGKRLRCCLGYLVKNCKLAMFETVFLLMGVYLAVVIGMFVAVTQAMST